MTKNNNNIDIEYALKALDDPQITLTQEFKQWCSKKENKELYKELRRFKEAGLKAENYRKPNIDKQWAKVNPKPKGRNLIVLWGSIAASIVLIVAITFLLKFNGIFVDINNGIVAETISFGSGKVMLHTSKGEKIELSNSTKIIKNQYGHDIVADSNNIIKYNSNSNIPSNSIATIEYHTIKVPTGAEYQMVLADGTKVWLNSETELKYPTVFSGKERIVELKGEAYFNVTHNKEMPFIVKTNNIDTKVLGTEFNVNAYPKENLNITLVAGSVMLNNKLLKEYAAIKLVPGQNALLKYNESVLEVKKVDVSRYIAWRDGYFHFEKERLEDIFLKLERWYDFNVFYQNSSVLDYVFKMRADRHAPFSEMIKRLESTNRIKIRIKGKTIIVSDVTR